MRCTLTGTSVLPIILPNRSRSCMVKGGLVTSATRIESTGPMVHSAISQTQTLVIIRNARATLACVRTMRLRIIGADPHSGQTASASGNPSRRNPHLAQRDRRIARHVRTIARRNTAAHRLPSAAAMEIASVLSVIFRRYSNDMCRFQVHQIVTSQEECTNHPRTGASHGSLCHAALW